MIHTSFAIVALLASLLISPALAQTEPVGAPVLSDRDRIKLDRAKDREDMMRDTKRPWDKPRPDADSPAPPPAPKPPTR
jgi:hypothetical protein